MTVTSSDAATTTDGEASAAEVFDESALFLNYKRAPIAFERGRGATLFTTDGRAVLDFLAGLATSSLGHNHPRLVSAVQEQAARYIHVSNLYHLPEQAKAARLLVEASRGQIGGSAFQLDRVFFCNSGAEANEAAIKLARKWATVEMPERSEGRAPHEIVVTDGGFHGRTMGALAATGTPRYHEGFSPLPAGFVHVPYGDLEAMSSAVGAATCAVLIEPIQGENGVIPAPRDYLLGVEKLCRERGALLMLDEVQTGVARTGSMFAYQHYGVRPDVMTLAKGLGGGVPVGAVMAVDHIARQLVPGDHGSTFGGNALSCAAVTAVLETIREDGLLQRVAQAEQRLRDGLTALAERSGKIQDVRGCGLMLAIELEIEAGPVAQRCLELGLLVNAVRPHSIRLLPPLVVNDDEIDGALDILGRALADVD